MTAAAFAGDNCPETEAALRGLWFAGQKYFPPDMSGWIFKAGVPVFEKLALWIENYFAGKKALPAVPLAPEGTAFRQIVWGQLLRIPYGGTVTYGELAEKIRRKNAGGGKGVAAVSARAVGGAVGHNPISLIIPCHRVVGSGGSLTGYAGGLERKRALLELEGAYTLSL